MLIDKYTRERRKKIEILKIQFDKSRNIKVREDNLE